MPKNTADFNGDGKSDIVWGKDGDNSQNQVYLMNRTQIQEIGDVTAPTGWSIK